MTTEFLWALIYLVLYGPGMLLFGFYLGLKASNRKTRRANLSVIRGVIQTRADRGRPRKAVECIHGIPCGNSRPDAAAPRRDRAQMLLALKRH